MFSKRERLMMESYVVLLLAGRRTMKEVPEKIRDAVRQMVEEKKGTSKNESA